MYRIDALGNNLAKILITMQDTEGVWAYTDLLFEDFPTLKRRKQRPELKIVKKELKETLQSGKFQLHPFTTSQIPFMIKK